MKALKILFICAVVGTAAPVFAEGGSDRLIEQIDARHASSISR
ncbi:co-regulatory protein PtrA N-terminal domain-containing protein [Pseudomonas sp. OTU5201]